MRRMLERIAAEITGFVSQRDDLALVVQASATTGPAFLEILAPIAESSSAGLFHTHDVPFRDPESYVQDIASWFQVGHDGFRVAMLQEGMTPWPETPPVVAQQGLPPVLRLRELMKFSRSVLPDPDTQVVVWTFFPREITDPAAYGRFFRELLAHEWPRPWCHHMRVMVRDETARPVLQDSLAKAPRVRRSTPPLGPEAYRKGYEDAITDESLPVPERMTALLISAATDTSYGRHAQALEKYELLIQYHGARQETTPLAVAWNGVGELRAKTGDPSGAGTAFEIALAQAASGTSPQPAILYTVSWNLARLRMDEKRYAEAADCFGIAQQSAACLRAADLKLTALEWHGVARLANGERDKAIELWEAGATVAHSLQLPDPKEANLKRLRDLLGESAKQVRDFEQKLAGIRPVSA